MPRRDTCGRLPYFLLLTSLNAPSLNTAIGEPGRGLPYSVILSAAKDLSLGRAQILRCAQDDSRASVNVFGACPRPGCPCPGPEFQAVLIWAASSNPNDFMACWRSTNFCTLPLAVRG